MKIRQPVYFILLSVFWACKTPALKHGYVRDRKVNSFRQIIELKNGYLLVMLHTEHVRSEQLRAIGENDFAAQLEQDQHQKNLKIMAAFRSNYDFCPVYFFFNTDAEKLLKHGINDVTFLNGLLQEDTIHPPGDAKFLVAEFDHLQADTGKYLGGYRLSTTDTGAWRKPWYYTTSTFSYQALIIESPQLIQLKRPFKYFVMISENRKKIYMLDSVVRKLNRRHYRFLGKAKLKLKDQRFSPYLKDLTANTDL